ncbi:unnamed protein product [Effrenium voratum]|uniref:Uncharacterized protein n=1 Tax=Effrenium voratum TaxID=2562239 RepID=A0AA36HW12_9DINO|nr:unnamed protein product [Effrenium voratum]CAJ1426328.1 unnamed protein product [Effrenium voratum]CAJ1434749.1 unnamed protein product [Effrenium voratum]CAJ1443899.1 unnamed protein product [Effrenium voratum]
MAKIDGRIHISSCVDSTTGLITFEEQCVTGEEGLLCAVCLETIGFGAKAAAVVDTQRHCALCQLAADPENGEALRSHIMHTWCAEGVGLEACPACSSPSSGKGKKPAPIARIGFDIGGVIVRHRDMFDSEVDTAGLTGEDYLEVQAAPLALESLAAVVACLGAGNVHIISKCGPETESRTRQWMDKTGFFEKTGIQRENLHFCRDVKDKAPIVAELRLDGFVDDRIDVLRPMLSLPGVRPLLFMPNQEVLGRSPVFWIPRVEKLAGWASVLAILQAPDVGRSEIELRASGRRVPSPDMPKPSP